MTLPSQGVALNLLFDRFHPTVERGSLSEGEAVCSFGRGLYESAGLVSLSAFSGGTASS